MPNSTDKVRFPKWDASPEVNSIIPNGADIGSASVYRSVLFPGVVLESGADVRHSVLMPGVVIGRGAVVRRAIIDANIVIDAGDDIGCSMERDRRRFHALPNGVVIVSPDHLSPFFNKDVIRELRHVGSALSPDDQVHFDEQNARVDSCAR